MYLLVIKASFDVLKTTLSLGVGSCSSPRKTNSIYIAELTELSARSDLPLKVYVMKIKCENPSIIVNPNLENFLHHALEVKSPLKNIYVKCIGAYWSPSEFRRRFSPKKNNINLDNFGDYSIVLDDGECIPLYIVVPCGKCVLCRKRNSTDLQFRAMCESVYSKTTPLFITLTYEEAPDYGVCKEHLQKFFKRLRSSLDYEGIEHEIRYFAVGEYGSQFGRPHYHALLWNFPHMLNWKVLCDMIRKNWKYGFVYVEPLKKGGTNYVMKYLRKPQDNVNGRNSTFYLASRKNGGLGLKWCLQNADFYRRNPDVLTVSVTDPYTKTTMTCAIPRYFKDKMFPTKSRLVDKSIRDIWKYAQFCLSQAKQRTTIIPADMEEALHEFQMFRSKYTYLPCYTSDAPPHCDIFYPKNKSTYEKNKAFFDNYRYWYNEFAARMSVLKIYDEDVRTINWLLSNLENRNNYISTLEEVEINVSLLVEKELYDLERKKHLEVF